MSLQCLYGEVLSWDGPKPTIPMLQSFVVYLQVQDCQKGCIRRRKANGISVPSWWTSSSSYCFLCSIFFPSLFNSSSKHNLCLISGIWASSESHWPIFFLPRANLQTSVIASRYLLAFGNPWVFRGLCFGCNIQKWRGGRTRAYVLCHQH